MIKRQAIFLYLIFFAAGFSILANAQRYPELQHQLHLSNGEFGTYVSLVAIGSFLAFIYGSRIIHLLGIGKVLTFTSMGLYLSTAAFPHIHSATHFIIINILFGFFSTINHISINAQGIHTQNKLGKLLLPFLAGVWSLGALSTSLLATLIARHTSPAWNIDLVSAISLTFALIGLIGLRNDFMQPREEYEAAPEVNLRTALAPFKFMPAFSFGYILIVQAEFSAGDWSAIYAHSTLKASVAQSAVCYLAFMFTMASIRMSTHKINKRYSEKYLMKWVTRIGAIGFILFVLIAEQTVKSNQSFGLLFGVIAFMFLGFGSSFMVPLMFGIAARKSKAMPGAVIASIGLVSTTQTVFIKIIISWVAQATNLTIALMIPALMLLAGSRLSVYGEVKPKAN